MLWSCRSTQFSEGFMAFQHIFLSIKSNLASTEKIARRNNLHIKVCHSKGDRQAGILNSQLLQFHQVLSSELKKNPSVSHQSSDKVLRRIRKKKTLQFPSPSLSSQAWRSQYLSAISEQELLQTCHVHEEQKSKGSH